MSRGSQILLSLFPELIWVIPANNVNGQQQPLKVQLISPAMFVAYILF